MERYLGVDVHRDSSTICVLSATGKRVSRDAWRLVGPMHIAETRERARENVRFGLEKWVYYFREVAALPLAPEGADAIDGLIESGLAVIGDPDDAVAQLERLEKQSGGFGCFLHMAHNWADWSETQRSYELFARYVMPRFRGHTATYHDEWHRIRAEFARDGELTWEPRPGSGNLTQR